MLLIVRIRSKMLSFRNHKESVCPVFPGFYFLNYMALICLMVILA